MLTVLDGGMGGELIRRGSASGKGLWSAQALLDAPQIVAEVHADYIEAGARVITTNSYSTIPSYLAKSGLADQYPAYARLAGEIARRTAQASPHDVLVAGSLPPLSESYRFDLVPAADQAMPIYRTLARALDPYVDLFVCETMSSIAEACNAVSAAREIGGDKPVWVSWTLAEQPGGGLRSGEAIGDAYAALDGLDVAAYLFNCTTPEAIGAGIDELKLLTDKPLGAYPNRLTIPEGWTLDNDVATGHRALSVAEFASFANQWRRQGISIIGGCCGIGPEFIEVLK